MNYTQKLRDFISSMRLKSDFDRQYGLDELGPDADPIEGNFSIGFRAPGFWSEGIKLSVSVCAAVAVGGKTQEPKVTINLSHSSGGRDYEEEPDDVVAERAFSDTVMKVSYLADWIRDNREILIERAEAATLRARKEAEEKMKAQQGELRLLSSSGSSLGAKGAHQVIKDVRQKVHQFGSPIFVSGQDIATGKRVAFQMYKSSERTRVRRIGSLGEMIMSNEYEMNVAVAAFDKNTLTIS